METLSTKQIDALNELVFTQYGDINYFHQRLTEICLNHSRMIIKLLEIEEECLGDSNDIFLLGELMQVFVKD